MKKIIHHLSFLLSPCPNPRLQAAWNAAQLGLLCLPLSPFLGAICLGLAMADTGRQQLDKIARRPLNRGFAILAGWLVMAAFFAHDKGTALVGLFNLVPFFALFAAFSTLIQTPAQLRRIAWIVAIASLPVVLIGFGQLFWGWAGHPTFLWIVINWQLTPTGNPPGRMASVFEYANVLASYLVTTFILALGLWIETCQTFRRKNLSPNPSPHRGGEPIPPALNPIPPYLLGKGVRGLGYVRLAFLSVAVAGNAIALILTNSRNAWGIAGLACLAFAIYLQWYWLVGLVASVSGGVLWSAFGPDPARQWLRAIVPAYFWQRLTDELYPDRPVATLRTTQWQFAWDLTLARPWTGWGLRNFNSLYQAKMGEWLGHPHNLFLMLSSETGIPATLLFCGLVGWILAKGILFLRDWAAVFAVFPQESLETKAIASRQDRLIFFTYLVAFFACTLFHIFDVPLFDLRINVLGWLLLAAIWGVVERKRAIASPPP